MKKQLFYLVAFLLFVFVACQRELSFETGNAPGTATLQADINGDCLPKTVNGTYEVGVPLITTVNTISVDVNVLATGSYTITTDTVNGFYFNSSGIFTNLGNNTITLRGIGTPFTAGTFNFKVNLDTFYCDIQVTVLPAGSGGPADFTLEGAPNACTNANVQGTYVLNTALSGSNQVVLNVNVITIGTYNISTTFQGMTFSAAGAFATTGATTVTLQGSGTPTTAGTNTVPVTVGSSTCSFDVTVESAATGTLGGGGGTCTPATISGTYTVGTPLTASNTIGIELTITGPGAYNITTNTVAGISFSASGNASSAGTVPVTLVGSGTPTAGGMQTFTVSFGGSTCTFTIEVTGGGGGSFAWSFKQGTNTYQGGINNSSFMSIAGFTTFSFSGSTANSETLVATIIDLGGGINNGETYNTSQSTNNNGAFIFNDSGGDIWTADPMTSGASIIYTVTTHNATTKTITGTFSGTVKDGSNNTLAITEGAFTVTYP